MYKVLDYINIFNRHSRVRVAAVRRWQPVWWRNTILRALWMRNWGH